MDVTQIREELRKYNQEHLLQFWDELGNEEKHELYSELKEWVFHKSIKSILSNIFEPYLLIYNYLKKIYYFITNSHF